MIKPQRSTLNDKISPYDSSLSLDQVKKDLDSLKWQECPVQSIETVGPKLENTETKSNGGDVSSFKISRKRRSSKRIRTIRSIVDDGGAAHDDIAVTADVDLAGSRDDNAGSAQCDSSLYADTYSWEF